MRAAWCGFVVGSTLLACVGACAGGRPADRARGENEIVVLAGYPDVVVSGPGADVRAVVRALPGAAERLAVFDLAWRVPLSVRVHDEVDGFVRATGQTTSSLRAWTTWDTVHLLPRATWSERGDDVVVERLAHELCHAALWHRAGSAEAARARRVPRFVTEGVCSVVAGQAARRMPLRAVREAVDAGRVLDFEADTAFAYGVAHHVFASVRACGGDAAVIAAFDAVAAGAAVEAVLGGPPTRWLTGCPERGGGGAGMAKVSVEAPLRAR